MCAQVPLNLVESGILTSEKSELKTLAEDAGISILSNRPLHAIPPPGVWAGGDWERH